MAGPGGQEVGRGWGHRGSVVWGAVLCEGHDVQASRSLRDFSEKPDYPKAFGEPPKGFKQKHDSIGVLFRGELWCEAWVGGSRAWRWQHFLLVFLS